MEYSRWPRLSPTLTGTHVSHVRPDTYASKPRPSLVSSDQDPGYRIIPWQVWSLRRTVSTVDARLLILNPAPFPSFDPALIRVVCTVGRGVLRMAPRARISTEKPLEWTRWGHLYSFCHRPGSFTVWIVHVTSPHLGFDELLKQPRCDQDTFLSIVLNAQVEIREVLERDNNSKATWLNPLRGWRYDHDSTSTGIQSSSLSQCLCSSGPGWT
jgi:hypothetical protein